MATDLSIEERRRLALRVKQDSGISYREIAGRTSYEKSTVHVVLTGQDQNLVPIDRGKVLSEVADALGGLASEAV